MQPAPKKRPILSISTCPACGQARSLNEINCVNCGTRACPSGHILSFDTRSCPICGWEDINFKAESSKSLKNKALASNSSEHDEYTNHKIEFECPRCRTMMEDKDVKCPNCGQLGEWKYKGVRGKMPPHLQTGDDSSPQRPRK